VKVWPQRRQRGLTLIELMIAVVVSTLMIGLVFAIYVRISVAYRSQAIITELQQTVRAGRELLTVDVRQAGFGMATFRTATGAFGSTPISELTPLVIVNNNDGSGPDLVRAYYANARRQTRVIAVVDANADVQTADPSKFAVGDVVAIVAQSTPIPTEGAEIVVYRACVLRITGIAGTSVAFADDVAGAPYNNTGNTHCRDNPAPPPVAEGPLDRVGGTNEVLMMCFVARAYRVDPARKDVSVLQVSASGELEAGDWSDLGVGFTDLQLAARYSEPGDLVDLDLDGDPTRDWYSSENQETPDPTAERAASAVLTQVGIGLAVRTNREVSGVTSSRTPAFIDDTNAQTVAHNRFGDSPSIDLSVAPALLPIEHRGDYLYRWTQTVIDVRNLGVGR
jgi:prepilin-type N-terminal cleavage/methylation domain-containing protein